ncbi:MAG: MFS transporter [Phycisphaerales bacterium]
MPTLASLNPFARLERGREVFAWGMYDLANQSFQLLINTLLFSIYVERVVASDPDDGRRLWTAMSAGALLLVAILSPIMGAIADQRAWRREMLLTTGVIGATLTAALALVGQGDIALAFACYTIAAVACGLGENFLGAFLPEISTQKNIGFVSALGWTMSYVGALMLVGITALYAFVLDRSQAHEFRPMFVVSGLWFAAGILPAFLWLRERTPPVGGAAGSAVAAAFKQLLQSAKDTRHFRQLARFLATYFIYNMGTMTVIYFLGTIGVNLGFGLDRMLLFALLVAITAGITSAATARYQDRLGHKRTIMAFLVFWIIATVGLAAAQFFNAPKWSFWILSAFIGLALGGVGTATRALVGAFTPAHRSAEFFGVWGMINRLSAIAGIVTFGLVSTMFNAKPDAPETPTEALTEAAEAAATQSSQLGQVVGLLLVGAFFALGLILMTRIDQEDGLRTARDAEAARGIKDMPAPTTPTA